MVIRQTGTNIPGNVDSEMGLTTPNHLVHVYLVIPKNKGKKCGVPLKVKVLVLYTLFHFFPSFLPFLQQTFATVSPIKVKVKDDSCNADGQDGSSAVNQN
jgi:hypothetical protein